MYTDNHIDRMIGEQLSKENEEERKDHISSGKLSASQLGSPLQWQILHHYGIKGREVDNYTLRKFHRGKEIEDWLIRRIKPEDTQVKAEYRRCIGYMDALIDTKNHDFDFGVIPYEVKSVANAKFKRIMTSKQPDRAHILQAAYYALAGGFSHFAVCYIAADDLRILTWVFPLKDELKEEIDAIIDRYDAQIEKGTIPVFEAIESWHSNKLYNKYDEWMDITKEADPTKLLLTN